MPAEAARARDRAPEREGVPVEAVGERERVKERESERERARARERGYQSRPRKRESARERDRERERGYQSRPRKNMMPSCPTPPSEAGLSSACDTKWVPYAASAVAAAD